MPDFVVDRATVDKRLVALDDLVALALGVVSIDLSIVAGLLTGIIGGGLVRGAVREIEVPGQVPDAVSGENGCGLLFGVVRIWTVG